MRGRRDEKTGGVFAGIHGGFFRAENDADGRGSFAAVEGSMLDRLLRRKTETDWVCEGISEGLRLAKSKRAVPGGGGAKSSATVPHPLF